jgi:2-phospho-L-lactate guanylyltransferase
VWALVPVKRLHRSKQRLAGVLTPSERAGLAAAMLDDLLTTLEAVPGISRIHVLTADPALGLDVQARGHQVICENANMDLNANLDVAAARLASHVEALLVISADLPAATIQDMAELLASHQGGVTLVPATVDGGTNAIIAEPPDALPFQFGPSSLARHRGAARVAEVFCNVFEKPGLGHDMDRPDDLAWLLRQPLDSRASAFLNGLGIGARLNAGLRNSA